MSNKKCDYNCSTIVKWAVGATGILGLVMLLMLITYHCKVTSILDNSIKENNKIIQSIEVISKKTGKHYFVVKNNDLLKNTDNIHKDNHSDFLQQYYITQNNWLNIWLTILAIILGILAIAAPIIGMRFFDSKKDDIDKLINEAKGLQKQLSKSLKSSDETMKDIEDRSKEVIKELQEDSMKGNTYLNKIIEQEKRKEVQEYTQKARRYIINHKYNEAIDVLTKSLEIDSNDLLSLNYIGFCYYRLQDLDTSLEFMNRAMSLNPKDSSILNLLGSLYIQLEQYDKAINYLKEAISVRDDDSYHYNLSEAYIKNRDFTQAKEALNIFMNKAKNPYIFNDDKDDWEGILNSSKKMKHVSDIKNIIGKLAVIDRKDEFSDWR